MALLPYFIHPQVLKVCDFNKLECFNIEKYIFDDIHENHEYLQSLDPRDWKEQDHYAVLRLKKIRINASQELIKQAYRKQLLDHHPDKGKQRLRKCEDENNDYFTCITKAFDLLKDQVSRISYDSVDPEFDDDIPTLRDSKEDFFKFFTPVFQRNARWSKTQPVPMLGDENTPIAEVLRFYNFWDDFSSWREFSYLDKESKSQADCREERRFIDKGNKVERKKKSLEESKRINSMVLLAKTNDPRIIKYNAQRKAEKEEEKKAKAERKLEVRLAAEKALREEKERLEQEETERQLKLKDEMNNLKKQKDILKNRQKAEKRKLRKLAETYNYFVGALSKFNNNLEKSLDIQKAEMMNLVESLCLKMQIDDLTQLNEKLENATEEDIVAILKKTDEKLNEKVLDASKSIENKSAANNSELSGIINKCGDKEWTFELTQFLIKAINCHPPGTKHRWNTIAEYMNAHQPGLGIKEKQVVQRAKLLKNDDSVLKKEAAAHNFVTKADLTINEGLKNVKISDVSQPAVDSKSIWTIGEQKSLEMALKSIPSSDPARWDKISEMVSTRSKKECILRFKECAEKMKAKKAAQ